MVEGEVSMGVCIADYGGHTPWRYALMRLRDVIATGSKVRCELKVVVR